MIVFIAPYSPSHRDGNGSLGAARKIEFFLEVLSRLFGAVLLVNTAHNDVRWSGKGVRVSQLGNIVIKEISPRTYPIRSVGKLLNLLEVKFIADQIQTHGKPSLIWIYNPYALEALLARELRHRFGANIVLQFEDWVFARRTLHPKPLIDWLAWKFILPRPALCLAVNQSLSVREQQRSGCRTELCPGVVATELIAACRRRRAFSDGASDDIVVGYFGGLSEEKGADAVLDLAKMGIPGIRFHVSGTGSMATQFAAAAEQLPHLSFHGFVSEERLFSLIAQCDVLLNLHSPIDKMGNGVFPFKIIEYVASGRLVLSTSLPHMGSQAVMDALLFVNHDPDAIAELLSNAYELFHSRSSRILSAQLSVESALSAEGIQEKIQTIM